MALKISVPVLMLVPILVLGAACSDAQRFMALLNPVGGYVSEDDSAASGPRAMPLQAVPETQRAAP
jgi:hypothetical protein